MQEQIFSTLLEIRDTLLDREWQDSIGKLPKARQHEVILLISQAQMTCMGLQRSSFGAVAKGLQENGRELQESINLMRESMNDVSRIATFISSSATFISIVQNHLKVIPPLA